MLYLTADLHIDHCFVATLRGYKNLFLMQKDILQKWNTVVTNDDTVYILGDAALYVNRSDYFWSSLQGDIYLIPGNHDHSNVCRYIEKFGIDTCAPLLNMRRKKLLSFAPSLATAYTGLTLCHYPMISWGTDFLAHGHLHGDSHRRLNNIILPACSMDVGWDIWQKPLSLLEFFDLVPK